jgi:uncharacterized membrane protein
MQTGRTLQNRVYGRVSKTVSAFALFFTTAVFLLYLSRLFTPSINFDKLPEVWSKSVSQASSPTGWSWILNLDKIDYLALLGLFFLILSNIVAYISVLPVYLMKKNYLYAAITAFQLLIFIYAAVG